MTVIRGHNDPTIRDVRAAVSQALHQTPSTVAADLAACSPRTIQRALAGENVTIRSLTRIVRALGYDVRITLIRRGD